MIAMQKGMTGWENSQIVKVRSPKTGTLESLGGQWCGNSCRLAYTRRLHLYLACVACCCLQGCKSKNMVSVSDRSGPFGTLVFHYLPLLCSGFFSSAESMT